MEQIDIMPIKQGSGPAGTRELLSTGKPLLAALNLTPIGRGILGAIGTMATIPEETEAGIFTNLGKFTGKGMKLTVKGMSVFPERVLVHEIPTKHWTDVLNTETMASAVRNLKVGDISNLPQNVQAVALKRLQDVKAAELLPLDKKIAGEWNVRDSTNALYGHREAYYPKGVVAIRPELAQKPGAFETSFVHEYTHLGDEASPATREAFVTMDRKNLAYEDRVTEVKAFTAGSRAGFGKEFTDPTSKHFVHPLISYSDGVFSNEPFIRYMNALKAEGRPMDTRDMFEYADALKQEVDKLQANIQADPLFKRKLDEAVANVPLHYEDWVFSEGQKKARGKARVAAYKAKKAAEAEALDKTMQEEFAAKVAAKMKSQGE